MPHPTVAQIRAVNKGRADSGFLLRTCRVASPFLAWATLRLRLRPLQVSSFNFFLGMSICVALAVGGAEWRLPAAASLILWQLLDTTDGTMARVSGIRSNFGGFVDHLGGIYLVAFLMLSLGLGVALAPEHSVSLEAAPGPLSTVERGTFFVLVGGFSSVTAVLMRLTNRIVQVRFPDRILADELATERTLFSRISLFVKDLENVGGYLFVVLLVAALVRRVEWFVLGYGALYLAMLLATTAKTMVGLRHEDEYPDSYRS